MSDLPSYSLSLCRMQTAGRNNVIKLQVFELQSSAQIDEKGEEMSLLIIGQFMVPGRVPSTVLTDLCKRNLSRSVFRHEYAIPDASDELISNMRKYSCLPSNRKNHTGTVQFLMCPAVMRVEVFS